ncbi:vacuolar protein-sorting-associated protein 36-like [Saccoglossus kowalevskii]|uniref:Vacuolar protein-sorting-associated protein 36 n=1 Tax=Saccoglossus kowalevskii TaxID=10224 RepID=A0ABM0MWT5_SACKO|nr:PREDICTED: vacuolar protein-sorting-associated protein 36-like [Saccoglossus kowalevskii]
MDRFEWSDGRLMPTESIITQQSDVKIYDGEEKTQFERGNIQLTSYRILWQDAVRPNCSLCLNLRSIVFTEEQKSSFTKSPKIVLFLHPAEASKPAGPVVHSQYPYIRISFKEGGQTEFYRCLSEQLSRRLWEHQSSQPLKMKKVHAGIVGIERKLEEKRKETDQNISMAFQDLNKLMHQAKQMVDLSKNIATKIKEKKGDITEDETVKFKAYLLSLGITNPVTRETHGSGTKYHKELAKQLATILETPIKDNGGIMALTDVYCRVNRARGMELLSPDDLVEACKQFEILGLPLRLRIFASGVKVLELVSHAEEQAINQTVELLSSKGCLSADELSHIIGISVLLAKGRLLAAEEKGRACRDESVEGIRFFPNLFKTQSVG